MTRSWIAMLLGVAAASAATWWWTRRDMLIRGMRAPGRGEVIYRNSPVATH